MRRNVEMDLPGPFARHYGPALDQWLESAIPGSSLCIPLVTGPAASPFVTSSALERNTITLRAVDLSSSTGPCLLVEPADAHSRRLVDSENTRLGRPNVQDVIAGLTGPFGRIEVAA